MTDRPGRLTALGMLVTATWTLSLGAGCSQREREATSTYYDRKIAPILETSCVSSATGSACHVTADDRGNALGNLDVTSYTMVSKRRDLLADYGPYGMPNLLLKNVPPFQMLLTAWDGTSEVVTTDITHMGGTPVDLTSPSFTVLERWLERGATENNAIPPPPTRTLKPCITTLRKDSKFDPTTDPATPDYQLFVDTVNPVLVKDCSAANCHGAVSSSLYLTCGETPEQVRWNYFAAGDYVASNAPNSEILRRALEPSQGGVYHDGGAIYSTPNDPNYQAVLRWIEDKGGPTNIPTEAGFDLFAKRVQPMLAKRGCMVLGCHSPLGFNDYRLQAGSAGYFSLPATRANYEATLKQVSIESPDPNASRLVRKNLPPDALGGIRHRGGPLLASGGDPSSCDMAAATTGPLDEQDPYCVIAAWIAAERLDRMQAARPLSGILYVRRPPAPLPDRPQDYESYAPGADLRLAGATIDADGNVTLDGSDSSLLAGCGLTAATADVRRPAVSWDATRLAFSARTAADEPLRIYTADADGSGCAVEPVIDAPPVDDDGQGVPTNGELVHNFDPAFAPDGRLVFVSTRGNTKNVGAFSYSGPQRTPADPSKLNANLYVLEGGQVRQLTFLTNQELTPAFKQNGQVLFTVEKRVPGFYQLAGRRINADGGDYHPLIGQRRTVGFSQVTDLVHLADQNFAAIFSERGAAHGAGTVIVVNRSLGPDQLSTDPADYTVDPSTIDYPSSDFYQRSLRVLDPAATGRVEGGTQGAYRNVSPLPGRRLLVSYAANVTDLSSFSGNFDVVMLDTVSGARIPLGGLDDPAQDELWPVAVYARYDRGVFISSLATGANGAGVIYTSDDGEPRIDRSDLTFLDVPLIFSLAFQNTRSQRFIPDITGVEVWESLPPEGITSLDDPSPFITTDQFGPVYARRRLVGRASLLDDGSARFQIPGGIPLLFGLNVQLAGDPGPTMHHQREEGQFYPGEWTRLSFRREVFDAFCGGCHGSVSGLETDVAVSADVITQASRALANESEPAVLVGTPAGEITGPPFP